jgi:hypothetical protein
MVAPAKKLHSALAPLGWDPFTGKRMEIKQVPQGGTCLARTDKYMLGPFGTLGELLVAMSTRNGVPPSFSAKQAEKMNVIMTPPKGERSSAASPRKQCPFTGKVVQIVLSDPDKPEGSWTIRGEKYLIGGFQSERHAQHFFSTRDGVAPSFSPLSVEVINREKKESVDDAFEGIDIDDLRANADKLRETLLGGKGSAE